MVTPSEPDPVLARRARFEVVVRWTARFGYGALLVAMVAFAAAFVTGFSDAWVAIIITALLTGFVVLPLPIIFGYGIRAAEREDREASRRAGGSPG